MKKIICILAAVMLLCPAALAESSPSPSPTAGIEVITPTPSAAPLGTVFSSEDLIVTLPAGLDILDEAARAGYDAAVQADFPDAARTILAAVKADLSAAVHFAVAEVPTDAASAAREAAEKILATSETVTGNAYGQNSYSGFACAIGDQTYYLYYLSNGQRLLIAGVSGLSEAERINMLTGLVF